MFDYSRLNDEQREAVLTTEGPVLVIAGPGTGKTFTIVKRIAYLVMEKQVPPGEIMAVTFTQKAARELITRISDEFLMHDVRVNVNEMYIGTFHAVCLRLLKENSEYTGGGKALRMMDAFEQLYLVCRNIELFNGFPGYSSLIPGSGRWDQAREICRYVNQIMEELVDVQALLASKDGEMRFLGKITARYRELLERSGAMDFSAIQTETYDMLKQHPEVLEKIRRGIRYIMVDEYQDTNYIQEQLVFLLSGDGGNLCVVGDDDQGMYRFRGATIRNILEFPSHFPSGECRIIHLNKNYRSVPDIIKFYNRWMENAEGVNLFNWDKYRYPKRIEAAAPGPAPEQAVYTCGGSEAAEQEDIYRMIRMLFEKGCIRDLNQVAVLFRSVKSDEARELAGYLEAKGIPVYSPRSDMFFGRKEVMQVLGCLMMCFVTYLQDLRQNSFARGISGPLREYYISCLRESAGIRNRIPALKEFLDRQAGEILHVKAGNETGLLDIFYQLISFEPFRSYMETDAGDHVLLARAARNLSEISRLLARFGHLHGMHAITHLNRVSMPEELFNEFLRYLYIDGIGEYEDESEYAPKGCISFMTIHQSKGLEFPVVVVGSLGSSPRENNDPLMNALEREYFPRPPFEPLQNVKYFDFWRLYYTAFSRACSLLVTAVGKRRGKAFAPYLASLPHVRDFNGKMPFAEVRKLHYKRVYSFTSHIAVYDGCPTQYKFYKEYGFARNRMFHTSVGSLVHATLEDMNRCIIAGHPERVNEEAIREWFLLNYRNMQEQTGYYLTDRQQEQALQQVIRYYRHRKEELGRVWKAEEEICLVLPGFILQGVIDLVEGHDDTVEIVDYKTGPKLDAAFPARVEHYRKQLEIYAYLIEKRYDRRVSRMHLYYTSTMEGSPLITFPWNRENVERTIREITETVRRIEAKDYKARVQDSYACTFCDMRCLCGRAKG